ncbi:MAG: Endonuclease/Exonuclease/phosphatase family [Solirubrobacteraceae bacterium]|nr:Endonuclease/Exonuclease/phosphatase family [Solirubrobacteraceae bacterium]
MTPDEVRVITFNTAAGNPRIHTRQADFVTLPFYREALSDAAGAPLLALQEVGDEQARALREAARGAPCRVIQMRRPGLGDALVIPGRYAVLSVRRCYYLLSQLTGALDAVRRRVLLGEQPNWRQLGELRTWIAARLRDTRSGRELTLLTTHLSIEPSLKVPEARAIVARALRADGPVVLAGDFNVPAGRARGRDVGVALRLTALRDLGPPPLPGREDIDYVLTRGLEPVSARRWTGDSLSLPGSPDAEHVSDHYAEDVVMRFSPA